MIHPKIGALSMNAANDSALTLGRYALHGEIASGGMATVYFGRLLGPVGFSRVVAIKRMLPDFASDPEFVTMFLDEANLAARIQHPNVVATLDVVAERGEIFIVMEYVRGEALAALLSELRHREERVPVPIALSIMGGALAGLHAAHEARSESGQLLGIVHRDVSPQNILVGVDGLARIVDFGIAKATTRMLEETAEGQGQVRGKMRYLAPEQLEIGGERKIDRGVDVFVAAAVLWEVLAGRKLYDDPDPAAVVTKLLSGEVPSLRRFRTDVSPQLEAVLRRALRRERSERFATALEFATELETAFPRLASPRAVGEWVRATAATVIGRREEWVVRIESAAPGEVIEAPAPSIESTRSPLGHPAIEDASTAPRERKVAGERRLRSERPRALREVTEPTRTLPGGPPIDMSERPTIPRLAQAPVFTDAEPEGGDHEEPSLPVEPEEGVSRSDADAGAAADVERDAAPPPAAHAGGWVPPSTAVEPYEIPTRRIRGPLVIAAALFAAALGVVLVGSGRAPRPEAPADVGAISASPAEAPDLARTEAPSVPVPPPETERPEASTAPVSSASAAVHPRATARPAAAGTRAAGGSPPPRGRATGEPGPAAAKPYVADRP